jgi:hypothetical protein
MFPTIASRQNLPIADCDKLAGRLSIVPGVSEKTPAFKQFPTGFPTELLTSGLEMAGTLAARELLARPRRFERPTFATGAFAHIPSEQNKARCRLEAFRLLRAYARP